MPKVLIRRDENGDVKIPKEFLEDSEMVFSLERQGKTIKLDAEGTTKPEEKPFWETATPEEWIAAFNKWIDELPPGPGLSDWAVSRDSIYD